MSIGKLKNFVWICYLNNSKKLRAKKTGRPFSGGAQSLYCLFRKLKQQLSYSPEYFSVEKIQDTVSFFRRHGALTEGENTSKGHFPSHSYGHGIRNFFPFEPPFHQLAQKPSRKDGAGFVQRDIEVERPFLLHA